MPISQGSAGGLPGLNLKAWAYVTAAGALVRGFNVASVASSGIGAYTINFTAAMSSAEFVARCTVGVSQSPNPSGGSVLSSTASSATIRMRGIATNADVAAAALWEFYE